MTKTRLMKDGEPDDNNISLFVDLDDSASQIPTCGISRNSNNNSRWIANQKKLDKLKRLNLQKQEMELNQLENGTWKRQSKEKNGTKTSVNWAKERTSNHWSINNRTRSNGRSFEYN